LKNIHIKKWVLLVIFTLFLTILVPFIEADPSPDTLFTNSEASHEYYTYTKMTKLLHELSTNYSDIMSVTSIGTTYGGRDVWMVKLSDNVDLEEDEPGVLLMGAHHGNEKPSFEVLIYFIKHVVEHHSKENTDDDGDCSLNEDPIDGIDNDEDGFVDEDPSEERVRDILANTQIFIIPMVSPDGVEHGVNGSRKTRVPNHGPLGRNKYITSYGVNLNRNYGYDWQWYRIFPRKYNFLFNTLGSSFNYRGPYPFSENETKAVKKFVESQNISISLSYHSYGEVMFYPWCHTTKPTLDEDLFISIGENMSKINKYHLMIDRKYVIPKYVGTLGTSENWLYGERGIIAFTMELCKTRAPRDPSVVSDVCLKHVGVNLYICERALSLYHEY